MTDNDQIAQRYADLLGLGAAFLPLVDELDAAAVPYRTLEPPPALDQAIEQMARQRRHGATNNPVPEAVEPGPPSATPVKMRHILPERLRGGYTRQLLGMAAAIVVLVLFAGVVAALLRGPGGQDRIGAGVVASPQATTSTRVAPHVCEVRADSVTFAQAQQLAPYYITEPAWLPSYLVSQCVIGFREGQAPDPSAQLLIEYGPTDGSQAYSVQIAEYTEDRHAQPYGTPTALIIAGHIVAYSGTSIGYGTHRFFVWHDRGTIFQLDALLGGPLTEEDVERMIASMLGGDEGTPGSSTLPTPNANGSYINLTLEQAQQLAPFTIVMPTDLPPSFTYGGLSLTIPPVAPAGLAKGVPNIANMTFGSSDDPQWSVDIGEIWVGMQPPNTPITPANTPSTSATPLVAADHALPPTFQIGDVTVTKDAGTNSAGDPVASYEWIQGKAKIFLAVAHFDVDHEPDIYNMIASMIAQGS